MFELLKKLTTAYGPAGRETGIADTLEALCAPYAQCTRDAMGNVIAHKPGSGKRIMIAAHMDSLGLVATYVEEGNFIRVGTLGGMAPTNMLNQRVRFESGVVGVIRGDAGVAAKDLTIDKCYIDTCGVAVKLGEVAVYDGEPVQIGDAIVSQYLDNRAGCAVGVKLLELAQDSDADLYVVFTTQEEVGCRGAGVAAFAIEPELAVAIDVTQCTDVPGTTQKITAMGKGPVIKILDRGSIAHPMMNQLLKDSAAALNIEVQYQAATAGGTDAGVVSTSRGGVPTGNLAIATRGIHSPNESCSLTDALQCAQVLNELVRRA